MIIEQDHARDRPTTRVAHGEEAVDRIRTGSSFLQTLSLERI